MLKSILGTNCDVDRLVPRLRRGPVREPLFSPKSGVRWSKMCTGQPSFCLPFGFYFARLFSLIFVGSSIVVPPGFPFFSLCLPCPFVFCFLAEDLCVHFVDFPFNFWTVSCEGSFSPFLILIFALGAKASKCISESFGRSGYIACRLAGTEVSSEETVPSIYQGST